MRWGAAFPPGLLVAATLLSASYAVAQVAPTASFRPGQPITAAAVNAAVNGVAAEAQPSAASLPAATSSSPTDRIVCLQGSTYADCSPGQIAAAAQLGGQRASSVVVAAISSTTVQMSGTAPSGWACSANNLTTTSARVAVTKVIATTPTSVTIGNFTDVLAPGPWVQGDVIQLLCAPY